MYKFFVVASAAASLSANAVEKLVSEMTAQETINFMFDLTLKEQEAERRKN
jgi:hypothetical protein